MPDVAFSSISIHLLDPERGRSLQTWSFEGTAVVSIGRGDDQSVSLADPYVSRRHAELRLGQSGWQLVSMGRNGVFVSGKNVAECVLEHGLVFRLGADGPTFRFESAVTNPGTATLSFDPESMIVLEVNRDKLEAEAQQVIETDFFQQLQQKARELRRLHASP